MSQGELFLTTRLKACVWSLNERTTIARANGGRSFPIQLGEPFWSIECAYDNLNDAEFRALEAWLARRQGGIVSFTAYRPSIKAPASNASADNSGVAVSVSGSDLTVTGLTGKLLSVGDMVGYYTDESEYWVGQVTAIVSSTSSQSVVNTRPTPPTPHATTSTPRIVQALGEFLLDPSSISKTESFEPYKAVSFRADQV